MPLTVIGQHQFDLILVLVVVVVMSLLSLLLFLFLFLFLLLLLLLSSNELRGGVASLIIAGDVCRGAFHLLVLIYDPGS